ncbi:MAG: hypothetical protein ABL958_21890, partial [Bdellovibrionia bacterium]
MADALMFTLFAFMFVGPLFLALVEGTVLHRKFGFSLLRSIFTLVFPNLIFAGLFMAALKFRSGWGFSSWGVDPRVENLEATFWGLALFWLVAFAVLTLPAMYFVIERGQRSAKLLLKATALSSIVSAVVFALSLWPVTEMSVAIPERTDNFVSLLPAENFDLYFVFEGKVWKADLIAGKFEPVKDIGD